VFAALVACGFGSVARASVYKLTDQVAQRDVVPGYDDYGYRGPRFSVGGAGQSSVDTYVCPYNQSISNWVVVVDSIRSLGLDFWQWSTGSGNQINIHVTNWSLPTAYLRLAGSCTDSPSQYPYPRCSPTIPPAITCPSGRACSRSELRARRCMAT
jgi:hypothetical protein